MNNFHTINPATGKINWEGTSASAEEINEAVIQARDAMYHWANLPLEKRAERLQGYASLLKDNQTRFAETISQSTGKPLWEAKTEVSAMVQKVPISIQAYQERCASKSQKLNSQTLLTAFRPHGVVAVFGPYNFPGHLPNGHIIPALLAGNTVLFKPSELTPAVGDLLVYYLHQAGIPKNVVQVLHGGPSVGKMLSVHPDIDGIFFTGSAATGNFLNSVFATNPGKILALEMGGNNPLVISSMADIKASAYLTIQSAFLTSGQRCSCARRLILIDNPSNTVYLNTLLQMTRSIQVGPYTDDPEPFMGPVISMAAAKHLLDAQARLEEHGANLLLPLRLLQPELPFLTPGILDVTAVKVRPDVEYFGPMLQLIRVANLSDAIEEANRTCYGLTAGLFSTNADEWAEFFMKTRAGVINWNTPLTGASSLAPFGGIGQSGNHRPSAYLAADYCSYPIASLQNSQLSIPSTLTPGITL